MTYLINKYSSKKRAHLWNDKTNDSYCRMYSTGGLGKQKKMMLTKSLTRKVCQNCIEKYRQKNGKKPALKKANPQLFQRTS